MKHLVTILALTAAAFVGAPLSHAVPIQFVANLGNFENPATGSPGTGFAQVIFDTVAHTLRVQANFSGLNGNTTAAHIHCCTAAPGNVGVATQTPSFSGFPLGVTSGSMDTTFDTTLASSFRAGFITANVTIAGAEAALFAGMDDGMAYFNIHTNQFPGGEIRGFLQRVPEPGSVALLGLGIAALGFARWRKH